MFKITTVNESAQSLVLRLEGRLLVDWIPEFRRACADACRQGQRVTLDVGGLSFVDAAGINVLRDLANRGCGIANGSPFLIELLREKQK